MPCFDFFGVPEANIAEEGGNKGRGAVICGVISPRWRGNSDVAGALLTWPEFATGVFIDDDGVHRRSFLARSIPYPMMMKAGVSHKVAPPRMLMRAAPVPMSVYRMVVSFRYCGGSPPVLDTCSIENRGAI
nr:MAG TPA: hypothetical protein [Caudoviricetes sp.]